MRFENLYEDIDCTLCNDMEDAGCPHSLCPHIMENLSDLRHDSEFLYAVENAGYTTFSSYLAKKRAEGKHYNVALSHAAKKLVRLIYALEKSREPYCLST